MGQKLAGGRLREGRPPKTSSSNHKAKLKKTKPAKMTGFVSNLRPEALKLPAFSNR